MSVYHVRWLGAADAPRIARLERRVYSRRQRSGKDYIRSLLAEMDGADNNMSMGLYRDSTLIAYILAYRVHDRQSPFDEFELDHVIDSLPGDSIYVEDVILTPLAGRHGYYLFRSWLQATRARAPGLPLDAFCQRDTLTMWKRHDRGFRLCNYHRQEPVAVTDRESGETWYWLSWHSDWSPALLAANAPDGPPGVRVEIDGESRYAVRRIQTERQWTALETDWRDLLRRSSGHSVFATPELLRAWWQVHGYRAELFVLTAWERETLVALAPMMIVPVRFYGRWLKQLSFIGDNSSVDSPRLIVDESHPDAEALLWWALRDAHPAWQMALLQEQAHDQRHRLNPNATLLERASAPLRAEVVATDQPYERYLSTRSRSLRKNLKRKSKRLEPEMRFAIDVARSSTDAARMLERFLAVEARSWKAKAGEAMLSKPLSRRYHRALVDRLPEGASLLQAVLGDGERDIAASLTLIYDGVAYALEIAHDERDSSLSPGVLLTGAELDYCCESPAVRRYDFLTGTPDNKTQWSTSSRECRDLYLLPVDVHARAAAAIAFRWRPAVKRVFQRIGLQRYVVRAMDRWRRRSAT